jgi:hypothetical protein
MLTMDSNSKNFGSDSGLSHGRERQPHGRSDDHQRHHPIGTPFDGHNHNRTGPSHCRQTIAGIMPVKHQSKKKSFL